ncbi:GNAT family N-acetyltransferase [Kribbella antibiotica]|uniref:GNAT family N-acetyltransferase n=1 Tax=Kribbella antibiotica TaxID=190195 RepID=UPI0014043EE4|nr:GNAT family N-acetyltransferase [Kribbella antibiotica]
MTLSRCLMNGFPATIFDPACAAPDLFTDDVGKPAGYLLIGGTDLVSGPVLSAALNSFEKQLVGQALVDGAFAKAHQAGLAPAALYVRDQDIAYFSGSHCEAVKVDEFATVPVRGWDSYLAGLSHGRRSVVRRDIKGLKEKELGSEIGSALELIPEAAPLVVAVKNRHQIPDHPRLVEMRLATWAQMDVGTRFGFSVRDTQGRLLAASFGCHHDDVLEMHEIGLADSPHRHLAYVEALVYSPLRLAHELGCQELQLGMGSTRPKVLRGAKTSPVWVVGRTKGNG